MRLSRRSVLTGAAATAALAVTGTGARAARAASGPVAPGGTTLDATVLKGPAVNAAGYRRLVSGPGEPHVVREDLGTRAHAGREGRRRAVLAFAHLTDIHVVDAQSPARVEYLDRYDDAAATATIFSAAYRPHEPLTVQVADAVVRAVRSVGVGPVTGTRLAFAICTGDNTDNCQRNELRWQMAVLDGTPVAADSGGPTYEGVADRAAASYDVHYWHPDGTPPGLQDDDARRLHGFPTLPGLLDVAIAQFAPVGIRMPWYSCYGNHDGLVQGNFPTTLQLGAIAVGSVKVVSATPSPDDLSRLAAGDAAVLTGLTPTAVRTVTPDPERRILTRRECVQEHFTTGGLPVGHGYTAQNVTDGTAYYVFDPAPGVRGIVLDTVDPNGYSDGSLDAPQLSWLRAQLELVSGPGRDRLVVVFSHHTIATMTNPLPVGSADPSQAGQRVLGDAVRDLLLQFPNVVAWVNGHTHRNEVTAHPRPGGGGFWEVNTAAHVDFPCSARLLELVDNRDGTLSLLATVVDAEAPLSAPSSVGAGTTPRTLAGLARELAANDWQERTDRRGKVEDRNVELLVAAPFPLGPSLPAGQSGAGATSGPQVRARSLAATGAPSALPVAAAAAVVAGLAAAGSRRAGERDG
jgi:metallophosphoesterase (TIGR03767 family)